jgi:cyclopropane fatty-acyl-phospholipid synthase-like methyltransferase
MTQLPARPFSQACENNKRPILEILQRCLAPGNRVMEIGSGTGQHARFFAENLPTICWQATDMAQNLPGIDSWRLDYAGDNLPPPRELDVRTSEWDCEAADSVFTANSLHIMAWSAVQSLFRGLAAQQTPVDQLLVYGPFNYAGQYTSESNARFDQWLAGQHPDSAIRNFEEVDTLAVNAGYTLHTDTAMPANNRLLHWRRSV